MSIKLLPIRAAADQIGIGVSTLYLWVSEGVMTRPIKIGNRAARIPSFEADAIAAARIAGRSTDEIRQLVSTLHAERASALDRVRPDLARAA